MGIFNRSKKEADANLKKSMSAMQEIEAETQQINQSPGMQTFHSMAHEEAVRLNQELKEREFNEQHKKIVDFKKEFDHIKFLEEYGIPYTGSKSEYMQRYDILCSKMPKKDVDRILFLPYLAEKELTGIITKGEQKELNMMLGENKTLESSKTTESYHSDYNDAILMLGVIGVLDFNENSMVLGYEKGSSDFPQGGIGAAKSSEIYAMADTLGITLPPIHMPSAARYLKELLAGGSGGFFPLTSKEVGKGTLPEQNQTKEKISTGNHIDAATKSVDATRDENTKE